jgi:hypothetical protein
MHSIYSAKLKPVRSRRTRASAATAVAGLAAVLTVATTAGGASADTIVHARYKVTGSTLLKGPGATVRLGPGTLATALDANTGKVKGTLTLPPATGSFKQLGLIPVTATTQFINDGPTTGTVNLNTGAVKTTSKVTLRIVSLSVAGIGVPVGNSCQTVTPAVIKVASLKGFNILKGGSLGGTYTIPQFANCLLATPLINATLPGPGNTIKLTLGKAKIG